jgi:hypothetical protein
VRNLALWVNDFHDVIETNKSCCHVFHPFNSLLLVALADKRPIPYKKTSRASIQESDRREEVDDQGDVKVGTNMQDQSDLGHPTVAMAELYASRPSFALRCSLRRPYGQIY